MENGVRNLWSVFFVLCFTSFATFAQKPIQPNLDIQKNKKTNGRLWLSYTRDFFFYTVEKGVYSRFDSVLSISKKGIGITSRKNYNYLSQYFYFMGHTYKVQAKSDSALYYLKKSIEYANASNNVGYEVIAIQQINYLYRFNGKFDETKIYVERLNSLLPKVKNEEIKDRILSALSEDYLSLGYYNKAISYILTSLPLKEKILSKRRDYSSKVSLGLAYSSLGNLYLQLNQNQNALSSFKLAQPYFEDYMGGRIRLYENFEQVFLNLNDLDSAMIYYKKIYASMSDRKVYYAASNLSTANRLLASHYLLLDINAARKYSKLAYKFAIASESKESLLYGLKIMGSLNYEERNYEKAIFFLKQALDGGYSFSKDVYAESNLKLAESFEKLGNFKESIKYYKIYNGLRTEIFAQKTDEEITKVEFKYKNAESDKQITNLSAESLTANKLLKQKSQLQVVLTFSIGLVFLIALLIYVNNRNKNKANIMLRNANGKLEVLNLNLTQANQLKAKLFSIISHDFRRPVSQLFTFLKLNSNSNLLTEYEKKFHQEKLLKHSATLLETMEDLLLWSKSQMEHFELQFEEIDLKYFFNNLKDLMQAQIDLRELNIIVESLAFKTVQSDYNLLYAILRNLMQNAIDSSINGGHIILSALLDGDGNKQISIANFGRLIESEIIIGMMNATNFKSTSSGYGLIIITDFAEKLGIKLKITSNLLDGTKVQLTFNS